MAAGNVASGPSARAGRPTGTTTGSHHDDIEAIVRDLRRIAVVGASDRPMRPSFGVVAVLLDAGFEVIPVNPNATTVHGIRAVATLAEVEGPLDLVDVFRRPDHAPEVARAAVAAGARGLWLQSGIRSAEARRIATDAGLRYVEDACLGVFVDAARHRHDPGSR